MIAAESHSGFPDFVLKTNPDGKLVGGEFIEVFVVANYWQRKSMCTCADAGRRRGGLCGSVLKVLPRILDFHLDVLF